MQEFLSQCTCIDDMIKLLERSVLWELLDVYGEVRYFDNTNLARSMQDIYMQRNVCLSLLSMSGTVFSGSTRRIRLHRKSTLTF